MKIKILTGLIILAATMACNNNPNPAGAPMGPLGDTTPSNSVPPRDSMGEQMQKDNQSMNSTELNNYGDSSSRK